MGVAMSAGTIAGDRIGPLAGPAPTPRVPLRPPSGCAVSSSISMPARPSCHRQASPGRERGCGAGGTGRAGGQRRQSPQLTPLMATARPAPACAGVSHRAAPMRAGLGRGPTAEGGPRHLAEEQVSHVHSAPRSGGSPGRRALAVILAIVGVLAIIAGILYVAGAANSLHFMVGSVHKGHHLVRAAVSFVVGVALLIGAWFIARAGPDSR
jgi:hypothetical protein